MPRRLWPLLILFSLLPPNASALSILYRDSVDSLELSALRCDTVLHARFLSQRPVPPKRESASRLEFELELIEPLKGTSEPRIRTSDVTQWYYLEELSPGDEVLMTRMPGNPWLIIPLRPGPLAPWTLDLRQLNDRASILSAFRAAIAYPTPLPIATHAVSLPSREDKLGADLQVPIDTRLEAAAQRWISYRSADDRISAARTLALFPSDHNKRLIASLLSDPAGYTTADDNRTPIVIHHVRQAAYDELRKLNVPVTQPPFETPTSIERFLTFFHRQLILVATAFLVPPTIWWIVRRHRRARRLHTEPLTFRRLVFNGLALGAFTLSIAVLLLHQTTRRHANFHFFLSRADSHQAFAIYADRNRARIDVQLGHDRPLHETTWAINQRQTSIGPGRTPSAALCSFERSPVLVETMYGCIVHHVPGPGTQYSLTCPTLAPLAFTGFLPAIWIFRQIHFHTRRRRAARGRCIPCGYDLRHSPSRCPECGTLRSLQPSVPTQAALPSPMLASWSHSTHSPSDPRPV